ncbi:MAG: hypothetical protein ACR2PM_20520 [Hyphomicrobiales bacterium]
MLTIDILGYAAVGIVLASCCMHSMTSLRISAILGNLAFIAYAYYQGIMPILVLHAILLPINSLRLSQSVRRRLSKE